jgi:hypothetical protein
MAGTPAHDAARAAARGFRCAARRGFTLHPIRRAAISDHVHELARPHEDPAHCTERADRGIGNRGLIRGELDHRPRIVRVDPRALPLRRIALVIGRRLAGIALGRRRRRLASVLALLATVHGGAQSSELDSRRARSPSSIPPSSRAALPPPRQGIM